MNKNDKIRHDARRIIACLGTYLPYAVIVGASFDNCISNYCYGGG